MEGARKGLMDTHLKHKSMMEVELADAIIRIFDLAESKGFKLGETIYEKLITNMNPLRFQFFTPTSLKKQRMLNY